MASRYDDVPQFANVAGPTVALHPAHGLRRKAFDLNLILLAESLQERGRQQGDIALPLAQGGQKDRHHIESIIEVLAKRSFADHLAQFTVGGPK